MDHQPAIIKCVGGIIPDELLITVQTRTALKALLPYVDCRYRDCSEHHQDLTKFFIWEVGGH